GTTTGLVWAVREQQARARALVAETEARQKALAALRSMTDVIVEEQMARETHLSEESKEFLRKIIKHFEGFAAITADDAESRFIRADGSQRVGLMRYHLGELKEAETAFHAALTLLKPLVSEFPTRPEYRRELGRTHHNLGWLLSGTGRPREAERA